MTKEWQDLYGTVYDLLRTTESQRAALVRHGHMTLAFLATDVMETASGLLVAIADEDEEGSRLAREDMLDAMHAYAAALADR